MAEITQRRVGELVRGVFKILESQPDGMRAKHVIEKLPEVVPPTPFEETTYPNNPDVKRYGKIVRFSTIGPVKAGWMTKTKGLWAITDEGLRVLREINDPEEFTKEFGRLYREWKKNQKVVEDDGPGETPGASTILEEAVEASWTEIEEYMAVMNPYDFQNMIGGLLRGMGYSVAWISPPGPDKGLDILAHTDPLGVKGPRIKVQVKRRADKISVDGIRSFLAILSDNDVGIFVSIGGFTKDSESEARSQERRKLVLIDLQRLFDLWVEHYDRIPEESRSLLPLRPVYFLVPDD